MTTRTGIALAIMLVGLGMGRIANQGHAATLVTSGPLFTGNSVDITRSDNSVLTLPLAIWDYSTTDNGSGNGFSKAEASTFYNGKLYLSGDTNANRFNGRVLEITATSSNDLSAASAISVVAQPLLGFEGMTVNPTATGFGNNSGTLRVTGVDATTPPFRWAGFGSDGVVSDSLLSADFRPSDVAFVGSRDRFAVVLDTADAELLWVDKTSLAAIGAGVSTITELPAGAKGMTVISASAASFLAGTTLTDPEYLLVSAQGSVAENRLALYQVNDDFTIVTALKLGSSIDDQDSDLESVAFDPVFNRLYLVEDNGIADVGGTPVNFARIYTFAIPEPSSMVSIAVAGLMLAWRRRQSRCSLREPLAT